MGKPSVHPTGTIVYKPEKCFNGYTLFPAFEHGATLIDMNGGVVNHWHNLAGMPNKLLPGGYVMGNRGERAREYGYQDGLDLVQVDWDGNVIWCFDNWEWIEDPDVGPRWAARQHHDYQREGNPVGYYVPEMECKTDSGNTLILSHQNLVNEKITPNLIYDDVILEVDWNGNIIWKWACHEHFDEFGFDEAAKKAIYNYPAGEHAGAYDWMHINSMSYVGPNKWYDAGDERFHPENIIVDGRNTNITWIISKATGEIVWKLGPDYSQGKEREIGWIIGQHHAHVIPKGLPGAGNILIYDNGGFGGYGEPNPMSPTGVNNVRRDYSRIVEIDPVKMEIVWQCRPMDLGHEQPFTSDHFYSCYISSAQRLPNGNTLITEGSGGHLIEITENFEIVWEYISPYWGTLRETNMIYRAYRYPYEYVPQVEAPKEVAIAEIDINDYRLPGAKSKEFRRFTKVADTMEYAKQDGFCLTTEED